MTAKQMHPNSLHAHREGAKGEFSRREQMILNAFPPWWLGETPPALTDREIANQCGFADLNAVRPRITEMVLAGVLREVGDTRDISTGKKVRLVTPAEAK